MKSPIFLLLCSLGGVFFFPGRMFSQDHSPRIEMAIINREIMLDTGKHILRYGCETFGDGVYRDSLVNYMDTIRPLAAYEPRYENQIYQAVWGADSLIYRVRPAQFRTHTYNKETRKKSEAVEVESQIPPYHRFTAITEGMDEVAIAALTDSMRRMKADSPILFNNCQTCIFYALEAFFKTHRICPEPIITRNSNFEKMPELNAFFDYFLTAGETYVCRYKEVKNKSFRDNSVLAFIDDNGFIIHAVFYREGLFYTKNGMHPPVVMNSIKPIMQAYGRWDTKKSGLSAEGKKMLAQRLVVYTLNEAVFSAIAYAD